MFFEEWCRSGDLEESRKIIINILLKNNYIISNFINDESKNQDFVLSAIVWYIDIFRFVNLYFIDNIYFFSNK